jgi:iron complex outermembrane recepter protein
LTIAAAPVCAQTAASAKSRAGDDGKDELVIRGKRGSAISDIAPVATFDSKFVEGTGATSMDELLRTLVPMARSADGGDPILLLNGQRISGYEEIQSLPPEALAGTEILPEAAAVRYGYPPTRRLLNFMTKPKFRQIDISAYAGRSTAGGAGTAGAKAGMTRLAGKKRLTLAGEYNHTDPLLTSGRPFTLDPDDLFDPVGNVVAANGGEIDPALSAAAGHPVFTTAVPADPAARGLLSGYLPIAGRTNQFDVRPTTTLIERNDAFKGNAVIKQPLAPGIDATLTLTAEHSWGRSLQGQPSVFIYVPATNPFSPFDTDVFLYRRTTDRLNRQRSNATTLHAGGVVQGGVGGWQWDVTTTLDQSDKTSNGDRGYSPFTINQAVAGGADPFGDLTAAMLGPRLTQRASILTRKAEIKAVARGTLLHEPAGEVTLVSTVEGGWNDAHSRSRGFIDNDVRVNQSRIEGGLTLDVPITSKKNGVLPFVGDLSVNLSGRVRDVRDYGTLHDTTYGFNWTPVKGLQFTVSRNITQAVPNIEYASAATVQNINAPIFDFGTGRSVYVTLITGGNPDLTPEHRRVQSYGFTLKPFDKTFLTLSGTYSDTRINDIAGIVGALTPITEAELPEQFQRDAFGRLTTVEIHPFNFYRQRQRSLNFQVNFWTQFGKAQPAAGGKPARSRGSLYVGMAPNFFLRDRLELKPGMPALNLLGGDTINGWQGQYRVGIWGWGGLSRAGDGFSFTWQYTGPSHIDGGSPQTDLHFSSRFNMDISTFVWLRHWFPKETWLKKTKLTLQVANPFDTYVRARDANGNEPFRYQRALTDAQGRTIKITLRRLFQ